VFISFTRLSVSRNGRIGGSETLYRVNRKNL